MVLKSIEAARVVLELVERPLCSSWTFMKLEFDCVGNEDVHVFSEALPVLEEVYSLVAYAFRSLMQVAPVPLVQMVEAPE